MTNKSIAIFVIGAVTGFAVAQYFALRDYKRNIQSRLDTIDKKMDNIQFSLTFEPEEDAPDTPEKETTEASFMEYQTKVRECGYTDYSKHKESVEDSDENINDADDKPYVISPDIYGNDGDYDMVTLYYYTDGVVADEDDEVVDDIDDIIGEDSLKHFGEHEKDSVFVRNDRLKCDYEILRVSQSYAEDILGYGPYGMED